MRNLRRAFTTVELLVVLAVMGVLLTLIVPAVQSVREQARSVQCTNNLRQIGLALQSFEAAQRRLPLVGNMQFDGTNGEWPRSHAPHLYLLNHMEQRPLFDQVDRRVWALRDIISSPLTWVDPNHDIRDVRVASFVCPSDPNADSGRNSYRANLGLIAFPQVTSLEVQKKEQFGPFLPMDRWPTYAGVTDGLSNTAAFSERLMGDFNENTYTPAADVFHLSETGEFNQIVRSETPESDFVSACSRLVNRLPIHDSSSGKFWLYGNLMDTWYSHLLEPNSQIPDCGSTWDMFGGGVITARSRHPNGVNVLMMDGSVRLLGNSVTASVWQSIGTRAGREVD